jgi:hexaprenyl-diphosphate synthase
VDDLLDFTGTSVDLGKPSGGSDLQLGLATAPVLYASLDFPTELRPLMDRRFNNTTSNPPSISISSQASIPSSSSSASSSSSSTSKKDDVGLAWDLVHRSRGLVLTRHLAEWHSAKAVKAAMCLPPSDARDALVLIAQQVLTRTK